MLFRSLPPSDVDLPRAAAGGPGGDRGTGPTDAGADGAEELAPPLPHGLRHAGPGQKLGGPVTGLNSSLSLSLVSCLVHSKYFFFFFSVNGTHLKWKHWEKT